MSGSDICGGGIFNHLNFHLYHYAGNNPVRYTDPTGMFDWDTNTIQEGDTLSQIVKDCNTRYGTNYTADDLQGLNSDTVSDKDKIYAGNHLNLGQAENVQKRAADYTSRATTQYSNEQVTPERKEDHHLRYGLLETGAGLTILVLTGIRVRNIMLKDPKKTSQVGYGGILAGGTLIADGIARATGKSKTTVKEDFMSILYNDPQFLEGRQPKKRCKNPFITDKGYMFYYEGDRYSKENLNKLKNGDNGQKQEYKKLMLEIKHASLLADNGFKVYMPKEPDNISQFDAIVNNIAIDFKYLEPDSNIGRVEKDAKKAFKQGQGMSLFVDKDSKLDQKQVVNTARKVVNNTSKNIKIIDIYFEKNNNIKVIDARKKNIPLKKGDLVAHNEIPSHVNQASLNSLSKTSDSLSKCFLAKENLQFHNNVFEKNVKKNIEKSLTYSGHKLQGRTKLYGMDISIENKKGTYRKGTDSDGHNWKCLMHYDYGYIRGTVGTDGDHVDCYIGPYKESKYNDPQFLEGRQP